MLEAQRAAFFADLPVSLAVRRDRLARAMRMIEENADALCAALAADQANQDAESAQRTQVAPALAVLRAALDNVGLWMRTARDRRLLARPGGSGGDGEYLTDRVMGIAVPASRSLPP